MATRQDASPERTAPIPPAIHYPKAAVSGCQRDRGEFPRLLRSCQPVSLPPAGCRAYGAGRAFASPRTPAASQVKSPLGLVGCLVKVAPFYAVFALNSRCHVRVQTAQPGPRHCRGACLGYSLRQRGTPRFGGQPYQKHSHHVDKAQRGARTCIAAHELEPADGDVAAEPSD